MTELVWKLSPSIIESYFAFNGCIRSLVLHGLKNSDKKNYGFSSPTSSSVGIAASAGDKWEQTVINRLTANYPVNPISRSIQNKLSKEETCLEISALSSASGSQDDSVAGRVYIYQPSLSISREFLYHNMSRNQGTIDQLIDGNGKFEVDIDHPCYPDLIRADWDSNTKKYILSVVDIKLAQKVKAEHKIQICFYIRLLREYLRTSGLEAHLGLSEDIAYTFNFGNTFEVPFATKEADDILGSFFNEIVPEICKQVSNAEADTDVFDKLDYCTGQKCEWCDNYELCIKYCEEHNEQIRLLPYITKYAQDYLKKLCKTSVLKSLSLDDVEALCSGSRSSILNDSFFWKRFLPNYRINIEMLKQHSTAATNTFRNKSTVSVEIPETEDIRIVLTAQKDEGYGKCYVFGISASVHNNAPFKFRDIPVDEDFLSFGLEISNQTTEYNSEVVIIVKDMSNQENAEKLFINIFHDILSQVNNFNSEKKEYNKKNKVPLLTLQTYVLDNYEIQNISEMLFRLTENTLGIRDDQKRIFDILFLIQGDKLVESTQVQPEKVRDFPVIVLTSLINRLFVLPAYLAYNISDVCNAFLDSTDSTENQIISEVNNSRFKHILSNALKNDVINEYWNTADPALVDDIKKQISARLTLYSLIVDRIRSCRHYGINGVKAKVFSFIDEIQLNTPELAQLLYEARYEKSLSAQSIIRTRCNEVNSLIADGKFAKLKCIDRADGEKDVTLTFNVINSNAFYRFDSFAYALCKDTADNREIIPFFPDSTQKSVIKINNGVIYNTKQVSFSVDSIPFTVSILIEETPAKISIQKNDECLLFEKFVDTNLWKNEKVIKKIDDDHLRTRFFDPYKGFYHAMSWLKVPDSGQIETDGRTNDGHTFSPSQVNAYKQFVGNNITLLLGPPGSGKTDFISRALLTLLSTAHVVDEGYGNKPFKILITANSHSAIDNVLFSLTEKASKMPHPVSAQYYKVDKFADNSIISQNGVDILEHDKLIETIVDSKQNMFVGSTVWALAKTFNSMAKFEGFDVVVIDEASQLRMVDAIIALSKISFSGRYLIVGDEEQLPAIIQGTYEKSENQPYILGSVFRYFKDCDRLRPSGSKSYLVALEENFRMNNIISRYSAERIYKPIYSANYVAPSFLPRIGTQKLDCVTLDDNLSRFIRKVRPSKPEKNAVLMKILDPEYPLVLCCAQGNNSSEVKKNELEWIDDIVKALENAFYYEKHTKKGNNYGPDNFWGTNGEKGDFGIISPHHEHISKLKNAILKPFSALTSPFSDNMNNLFIGTVDKLQGQERSAIVVSYGVTDVEQALLEGEFIYNLNRLNVAITRAKKKCIVFLTESILNYPIDALNSDNLDFIRGINYVCNFKKFMTTEESDSKCDSDGITNEITVFRKGLK